MEKEIEELKKRIEELEKRPIYYPVYPPIIYNQPVPQKPRCQRCGTESEQAEKSARVYQDRQDQDYFNAFKGVDLSRFIVFRSNQLFQLSKEDIVNALSQKKCPKCLRKLRVDLKGNGRCVSKYRCKYFITKAKLDKYL